MGVALCPTAASLIFLYHSPTTSAYLFLFRNMLCASFIKRKKDAIIVVPLPIYNSCWVLIPLLHSPSPRTSLHRFAWTVIEYSVSFLFNYELFLWQIYKYIFEFLPLFFLVATLCLRFFNLSFNFPVSFRLMSTKLFHLFARRKRRAYVFN